jgi:prepilin signal peptidase PulO-like enzyme (type II secretory pathway)
MMDFWLKLPPLAQGGAMFLWGLVIGGQINRGIYRLAYEPRAIGAWSAPASGALPRRWFDRVPLLGWWTLRRESPVHGAGYWIRPIIIELLFASGLTALYFLEMGHGLLVPNMAGELPDPEMLLAQFLGHALLLSLLTVATFIDFDERSIPDGVTIPGTLAALALATALPLGGLPTWQRIAGTSEIEAVPLRLTSPNPWNGELDGATGLWIGMACFAGWCAALIPRAWITRRGLGLALVYLVASMRRSGWCLPMAAMAAAGCGAIAGVWLLGGDWWRSLLTALVGMASGGLLVWFFRIVFGWVLAEEAMGFGDVTLMAMIGAFLGWQSTLIVFFLAPFAAVAIAVGQWLFTGRRDIAFGPYLCFAAVVLIVRWDALWQRTLVGLFALGWLIPAVIVACVGVMGPILWIWRRLRA